MSGRYDSEVLANYPSFARKNPIKYATQKLSDFPARRYGQEFEQAHGELEQDDKEDGVKALHVWVVG